MKDYYNILNISKNASDSDIKSAFRKLALEHHPDRGGDADKFKDINEAYEVLSDENKRRIYDSGGDINMPNMSPFEGFNGGFPGFPDFMNIHQHFQNFGFNFHTNFNSQPNVQNKRVESTINITLLDCFKGINKSVNLIIEDDCLHCSKECNTCKGRGQVEKIEQINQPGIPIGFCRKIISTCPDCNGLCRVYSSSNCEYCKDTHKIKQEEKIQFYIFPGFHERDLININYSKNGKNYNILIHCNINYNNYTRNEQDLIYKINIPFINSIIGNVDNIILPDGNKIFIDSLSFNEIIQNKKHYLTDHKGLPIYDRNTKQITGYGKLYIEYTIEYPKINVSILKNIKEIEPFKKEFSKLVEI